MSGVVDFFFGSIGFLVFLVLLAIYFLPTFIALWRRRRNALAIFLLNFFLGWSFVAWVIALVWSVKR